MRAPHTRELEVVLMGDILRRAHADPSGFLAMVELRLEATRRPAIRETMTDCYRSNLGAVIDDHVGGRFPGDRTTAVLLYPR